MLKKANFNSFLLLYKALQSLVDYDEDSDEDQPSDEEITASSSPAKRQKLENI